MRFPGLGDGIDKVSKPDRSSVIDPITLVISHLAEINTLIGTRIVDTNEY